MYRQEVLLTLSYYTLGHTIIELIVLMNYPKKNGIIQFSVKWEGLPAAIR